MSRSSQVGNLVYILKIEKFTKANKKVKKEQEAFLALKAVSSESITEEEHSFIEEEPFVPLVQEMVGKRILRELTTPDINQLNLCMNFPNIKGTFELKSCR